MKKSKKCTFVLNYAEQCKLDEVSKECNLSQNKIVNAAIRNLKIVKVMGGEDYVKLLYEIRTELKELKINGYDVSCYEKKLDDSVIDIYASYPSDSYLKTKLNESEAKNRVKNRTREKVYSKVVRENGDN